MVRLWWLYRRPTATTMVARDRTIYRLHHGGGSQSAIHSPPRRGRKSRRCCCCGGIVSGGHSGGEAAAAAIVERWWCGCVAVGRWLMAWWRMATVLW
nr:hypothetical protein [Tanacetum cinerariifolium]